MTKRKPVLVLFILTALLFLGSAVLFLLATVFAPKSPDIAVSFLDLNKGILGVFTSGGFAFIAATAVEVVLFTLIPLIVHLVRKQHSVTILTLIGSLVALYISLFFYGYIVAKLEFFNSILNNQAALEKAANDLGLFFILSILLLLPAYLLELITFIVDMAIRAKREPAAVPTAAEMREEPKAEEPAPAPAEEPAPEEAKAEEPAAFVAAPAEEPEEEEEAEEEGFAAVEEEEEKPAPKKAPAKKAAPAKKPEAKKAPAKKAEPKKEEAKKPASRATQTIKKPATRETTTIKKPARETQTVKKAEILTNEEGKSFAKAYHISQRKELNKWQVKGAGSDKALKLFDTQKEAIEYANQLSANNGAAVRVHSRAGKMRKA